MEAKRKAKFNTGQVVMVVKSDRGTLAPAVVRTDEGYDEIRELYR